jgi:hypothetical protein
MKEEVERLLPLIKRNELSEKDINALLQSVTNAIKQNPLQGKALGPLIAEIKAAQKEQHAPADVNWVNLINGGLGIGHKPGKKLSAHLLKNCGAKAVLTLLHENEGAKQIGQAVNSAGLEWIWFPFSASRPDETSKADI